jgi:hypothetical protein
VPHFPNAILAVSSPLSTETGRASALCGGLLYRNQKGKLNRQPSRQRISGEEDYRANVIPQMHKMFQTLQSQPMKSDRLRRDA